MVPAVEALLDTVEELNYKRSILVFQPHTYTRTLALFDDFADAFQKADELVLAEIYAAREKNIYKISSASLAEKIKECHPEKKVSFMESFDEIADYVYQNAQNGDLVLTMGAGDIYKVGEILLNK